MTWYIVHSTLVLMNTTTYQFGDLLKALSKQYNDYGTDGDDAPTLDGEETEVL